MESATASVLIALLIALATAVNLPSLGPAVSFWHWSSMLRLFEWIT